MQPGSLEPWTDHSCGIHLDARAITTTLKEHNTTFICYRNMTVVVLVHYMKRLSSRSLPDHLHRYVMIDRCLLGGVTGDLGMLLHVVKRVNIILCTGSMFLATSAHQVLCSTIQLIWAPKQNVTILGLPRKYASMNGCSDWHFYDHASLTRLFPFHIPWFGNVATSHPTLRNSVIRGTCYPQCNISNGITLLSHVYNFTIADCSDRHTDCDFNEFGDRRMVREVIGTGVFYP